MVMAADQIELGDRRHDLTGAQRSELYFAALSRFHDFPGAQMGLPHAWEIFAWIDIVSPREGHVPNEAETLQEGAIRAFIGGDPDRLLLGPDPAVTAAPLAALAHKRPDLSVLQRHELLVAGRSRLARPGHRGKLKATTQAIFAWIDIVVPARKRATVDRTKDDVRRPAPSLDELEDRVYRFRQGLRVRDQMEALEADQALERLVSPHPQTFSSGPMSHERRAQAMTTAMGASAREALAQMIDADAANGEGYFVIVRPNGASPLVAKGQFRASVSGRDLIELERAGVLLPNSRNADGLKTFYLSSDARRLLDAALAAAVEPTPLNETSTSEPGPRPITTGGEGEAKRADRFGVARGPGRPGWTAELFRTRYAAAEGRAKPPYTYAAVAPYFEMLDGTRGTDPEYFRKLVRRYRETPE
jgi:hypothetical protein